jgi:hypothetical protein
MHMRKNGKKKDEKMMDEMGEFLATKIGNR